MWSPPPACSLAYYYERGEEVLLIKVEERSSISDAHTVCSGPLLVDQMERTGGDTVAPRVYYTIV